MEARPMQPATTGGEPDLHALIEAASVAQPARGKPRRARASIFSASPGEIVARVRAAFSGPGDAERRRRKRLAIIAPIVLIGLGGGAWWMWGPMSQPDFERGNMRRVLTFAMLTDEFNKLPVEERMKLLGQLVQRFQSMGSGDSALMAAFAAGVSGKAREQIEENASRLMIDLWDKYSEQYAAVPEGDRGAFLDKTIVEFQRLSEVMTGRPNPKSDAELLDDAKKQAQRDSQALKSGDGMPPTRALGRMVVFMRDNVGGRASPAERARGQVLMRDMVQHLRGGQ